MTNGGTTLNVTVTDTYTTKFLPVVGIGSMSVTGRASATLLSGVDPGAFQSPGDRVSPQVAAVRGVRAGPSRTHRGSG